MALDQTPDEARARRSVLYVPASNVRAMAKARDLDCDGVILDLEDSVTPEAKEDARRAALEALRGGFGGREVVVRCNGLDTPWGAADLEASAAAEPDAVLAPKVSSAAEVRAYDRALSGRTRLWIMIETPRAVLGLAELAGTAASTRLQALVLGPNDLGAELGARRSHVRQAMRPILMQTLLAARAHGLAALAGVYNEIEDDHGLDAECAEEAGLGFDGKTVIHPRQIAIANRAFSPSPDEVTWARALIAAFAAPGAAEKGAIRLGGRMVERLHLKEAERLLSRARG
jgi:citrate lyase subunit beta/citryl-CoA lyase